jgi:linoleoyl-CoA desaturase
VFGVAHQSSALQASLACGLVRFRIWVDQESFSNFLWAGVVMKDASRIVFPARSEFTSQLKSQVDQYLQGKGIDGVGGAELYLKTALGYGLVACCYFALMFYIQTLLGAVFATVGLALGYALIAFNVMHDAAHGSYSRRSWLNKVMAASMDFMGGSSILWRQKHNQMHHTYTNIAGRDDDIDIGVLMRLSPNQRRYPWHRFQHIYAPFLYSLLTLFIMFYSDFMQMITGKIGQVKLQNIGKKQKLYFVAAKCACLFYTLVLPSFLHPFLHVLAVFLGVHLIFGLVLSVVFQMAHTVEGVDFPAPNAQGEMPDEWSIHQLRTTSDFAPGSRFWAFAVGGLNFQVEHHLFHRISHVHYPEIRKILTKVCEDYQVPYHHHPSFWGALKAHFSFLKKMGQQHSPA